MEEIEGRCHCGAVGWVRRGRPRWLTACNCSICHRLGALWAHGDLAGVKFRARPETQHRYVQGDRSLAFCFCGRCGCVTHWLPLQNADDRTARVAVNMRMAPSGAIAGIPIRRFDGADRWCFLDDEAGQPLP